MWRTALGAALFVVLTAFGAAAQQRETISFESRQKGQPVQITATIYWPAKPGVVPALVIHHGSGGISNDREGRYAREMAAMGVAGVVIDSFGPRGVRSTVQDQSSVTQEDFNLDAFNALKALAGNSRIDRTKIGIVGFSKGGTSALLTADRRLATAALPGDLRYALHVSFYPACVTQYYRPQTTGAPIYMLLGGTDTYVGFESCSTYAETLRAGGARIEVKVFPNAAHGFDSGKPYFDRQGENYAHCVFQQQADGSYIERTSGVMAYGPGGKPVPGAQAKALSDCRTLGVSGGPNDAARTQSMEDLKTYVRRHLLGG
jgi:dienelactone hydrolase